MTASTLRMADTISLLRGHPRMATQRIARCMGVAVATILPELRQLRDAGILTSEPGGGLWGYQLRWSVAAK